jgi:hypothetical protein
MEYHRTADIASESLRLEALTACVGFDDMLDVTLGQNHPHLDTMIVVTSHDDRATQLCAQKHGAICVQTDLFKKNGRNFNKGAALNAGMSRFQYHGWRLHLDSDIVLPDSFRRVLFNHTHLDPHCIYGADRMDVVGLDELRDILAAGPQHTHSAFIHPRSQRPISPRFVDPLRGYLPIGFFQLWHAAFQKPYPYSLGTAAHDDTMFSEQWATEHRRHLATVLCYHLCSQEPKLGENWEGHRGQPRLKKGRAK